MTPKKPRVALSLGDVCGISPEVVALALHDPRVQAAMLPVVYGDLGALDDALELRGLPLWNSPGGLASRGAELIQVTRLTPTERRSGPPDEARAHAAGHAAAAYLNAAIDAIEAKSADALCTAPLS
ncbi:MAG: 4-hydroxythreonine-4-phosphate dehydrogenase PdxA, partial [Deltaproteobacteria bacterium]|nr:4-hydroxythreonine-4-phosphate dehydrogenase PdxA [Deltaproteobacteria bacterium]